MVCCMLIRPKVVWCVLTLQKMEDSGFDECYLMLFMFLWKWQAWLLCWRTSLEDKRSKALEAKHLLFFSFVVKFDGRK